MSVTENEKEVDLDRAYVFLLLQREKVVMKRVSQWRGMRVKTRLKESFSV